MIAPEGMISVEEFAKKNGITTIDAINMIRNGFYTGRLINGQWFAQEGESVQTPNSSGSKDRDGFPPLTVLFYILAGLSLLGGLLFCVELWPGDAGYGHAWKTIAYVPSITWLTVGVVQFALFTAIGQGLTYLRQIVANTSSRNDSKQNAARDI